MAGSPLQVSGPAAGLAVIVFEFVRENGIDALGPILLLAGVLQIVAGALKLGGLFRAISPAVVHGMLAGIGALIVIGQFHTLFDEADEVYARVSGLPVRTLNLLMAVTTAVTVTIAMRTVGLLLVSALMVVPVAAAQQVTRGFRSTMTAAMAIGVGAAAGGVWLAGEADTAPGATIVILAIAVFVAVTVGAGIWRVLRHRLTPAHPRAGAHTEPPDVVLQVEPR